MEAAGVRKESAFWGVDVKKDIAVKSHRFDLEFGRVTCLSVAPSLCLQSQIMVPFLVGSCKDQVNRCL